MRRGIAIVSCVLVLGCGARAQPPCPAPDDSATAPSAGCLAIRDGKLLVVEDLRGGINLPGGKSTNGESARCTAHRETWEETGLDVTVGELLYTMDTGFLLYACHFHPDSGVISPPPRLEIKRAFLLKPAEFSRHQWRFPGQQAVLLNLVDQQLNDSP
jgi:8-oxo-dGTP pyrophosphatase MutT (NUDIX family)